MVVVIKNFNTTFLFWPDVDTLNKSQKPKKIQITEERSLKLIGCVFYGDPFHSKEEWSIENEIGLLWKRFSRLCAENREIFQKEMANNMAFEVHLQPDDYKETGKFFVYVGFEVIEIDAMPLEMFCKTLPTTKYAIFTFEGEEMFKGGEYIWKEWLHDSDYEEAYPYMALAYDKDRFLGLDNPKSQIDFYVPIKNKKKNNLIKGGL